METKPPHTTGDWQMINDDDGLMDPPEDRLYRLTQEGRYWGEFGAIALSKKIFKKKMAEGDLHALSGHSGLYYNAAWYSVARVKSEKFWLKPLWLVEAFVCYFKAMKLSDQLEKEVGVKNMSPEELAIRSSILRKTARLKKALQCSEEALSREGISPDSRVFLEIGLGEIMDAMDKQQAAHEAYLRAKNLITKVKPSTVVHYYWSHGRHHKRWGSNELSKEMLQKAKEIDQRHGLNEFVNT